MSDLVERLRTNAPADHGLASGDLMREAADALEAKDAEIERLQKRIAELERHNLSLAEENHRLKDD